jgi:hypothetical protein
VISAYDPAQQAFKPDAASRGRECFLFASPVDNGAFAWVLAASWLALFFRLANKYRNDIRPSLRPLPSEATNPTQSRVCCTWALPTIEFTGSPTYERPSWL